jgi:hypothetical protein
VYHATIQLENIVALSVPEPGAQLANPLVISQDVPGNWGAGALGFVGQNNGIGRGLARAKPRPDVAVD